MANTPDEPNQEATSDTVVSQSAGNQSKPNNSDQPAQEQNKERQDSNQSMPPAAEKARLSLFKAGAPPVETPDDVFARSITEADKEAVDKGAIAMMLVIPLIMLAMVGGIFLLAALMH